MACLVISALGPFQVKLDGQSVTDFESAKVRALLAYLAVEADRPHSRDALMALLWPDQPEQAARNNLRHALSNLRQVIGDATAQPPFLSVTRDCIQFNADSDHWLDIAEFNAVVSACEQHTHRHVETCKSCVQRLRQAVEHYRGDFLEQFFVNDSPAFEEWIVVERERLRRQVSDALHRIATYLDQRGEYEPALRYATRQLELDPWREEAHRQAMRALALSGQRNAALAQYERCRRVLADELSVEPDRATTLLCEKIKSGDLARDDPRHNLPAQLSKFIGREKEIAQLTQRLDEYRLVTLTGSGGVGKTRLAIQTARELLPDYRHGAWLVELAPLVQPDLVPGAVAAVLGVRDAPDRPLLTALTDYLREKTLLLVLDNCEHVIAACAQLAEHLLQSCPDLAILASSREALGVEGEAAVRVPSLSLPLGEHPTQQDLEHSEAVQLFVERAAATLPGFELTDANAPAIAQICRRLDGIALAIELAAARVKLLTVGQIVARLDDAFRLLTGGSRTALPRQQTLRATLDWSYNLLSEPERIVLRRLSVFVGGWTLEAAEAVCAGDGVDAQNVLDLLTQLANKSLVMVRDWKQGEQARYRLLEPTWQYAKELLSSSETEWLRSRHIEFFLNLAEEAEPHFSRNEQTMRFNELVADDDNLMAALDWSLKRRDLTAALRLTGALWYFWLAPGYCKVGLKRLMQVISLTQAAPPSQARAKALLAAGANFLWSESDLSQARTFLENALAVCREVGDKRMMSRSLGTLGATAYGQGDYASARLFLTESLALLRDLDDQHSLGWSLAYLGDLALLDYDGREAQRLYVEGVANFRAVGDVNSLAYPIRRLGVIALDRGDYERASTLFRESLTLNNQVDYPKGIATCLGALAGVASRQGQLIRAARLLGAAESLLNATTSKLFPTDQAEYDRAVTALRSQMAEQTLAAAWAEGRAMTTGQAIAYALEKIDR